MTNPLVSIIIATYRRAPELERAIRSALDQTWKNCEIIVVDDNDDPVWNEKVRGIFESLTAGKDACKRIENHPNRGSAKTRNIGVEAADGEYIAFLDDDDVFLPERIERQLGKMLQTGADYGLTDLVLYNEDESVNETRKRTYLETEEGEDLLLCHLKYHLTGTDTLMFRKEYLMKIGCFEPIDSGDEYYLMMKAVLGEGKICYLPRCDVKAYIHTGEGGLSSGKTKIKGEKALYLYKKQYFNRLLKKDRRYVTMRHFAVLAFAYLRIKKYPQFLWYGLLGTFASPFGCVKILKNRKA